MVSIRQRLAGLLALALLALIVRWCRPGTTPAQAIPVGPPFTFAPNPVICPPTAQGGAHSEIAVSVTTQVDTTWQSQSFSGPNVAAMPTIGPARRVPLSEPKNGAAGPKA